MRRISAASLLLGIVLVGCTREEQPRVADTLERHVTAKPVLTEPTAEPRVFTTSQKVLLGSLDLLTGIPGEGPLSTDEIAQWLDNPAHHARLEFELPMWLEPGAGQVKQLAAHDKPRPSDVH